MGKGKIYMLPTPIGDTPVWDVLPQYNRTVIDRLEYFIVENIFDGFVIKVFVFRHKELHDFHAAFLAQIEFTVCMSILTTIYCCTTE